MPAIPLNPCAFPCEGCLKSEKRTLHAASSRTPARAVPPGTLLEEVSSPTKKIHDLSRRGWNYIVLAQFPCRNHPLSFRMILAATEVYRQFARRRISKGTELHSNLSCNSEMP